MSIRVSIETENRTRSSKDCFTFKRWLPALNIIVGDLLTALTNGFNREFIQHAKNLRGDPIRGPSKNTQALTRAELSRLAGKEISRDVIGRLKRLDLIGGALRAPAPGAPFAYVTTKKFLEVFGLATLRDLPDVERFEDEDLPRRPQSDIDLDDALGLVEDEGRAFERHMEFEGAEFEDATDEA